jgi:hypothetical protein
MSDDIVKVAKPEVIKKPAEKAPEVKDPARPVGVEETKAPISLHHEITGTPYTAKFFEIEKIWDDPDLTLREDVETIEDSYRQKVRFNELEDGEKTFTGFIREAEKATNSKNAPAVIKIAKIAEFVKFMSRMDRINKMRRSYVSE